MALIVPPRVIKQLAGLPKEEAKRLLARLEQIAETPHNRHPNVRPLAGEPGTFRLRQGNLRAVFSVEDGDLILDRVAHRREVHR